MGETSKLQPDIAMKMKCSLHTDRCLVWKVTAEGRLQNPLHGAVKERDWRLCDVSLSHASLHKAASFLWVISHAECTGEKTGCAKNWLEVYRQVRKYIHGLSILVLWLLWNVMLQLVSCFLCILAAKQIIYKSWLSHSRNAEVKSVWVFTKGES